MGINFEDKNEYLKMEEGKNLKTKEFKNEIFKNNGNFEQDLDDFSGYIDDECDHRSNKIVKKRFMKLNI